MLPSAHIPRPQTFERFGRVAFAALNRQVTERSTDLAAGPRRHGRHVWQLLIRSFVYAIANSTERG
jgi:hypothetical protein